MDDNWTVGTAACDGVEYKFNVKHYDEPSEYGIRGGRGSKLWLAPKGGEFRHTILNYDADGSAASARAARGRRSPPSSRRSSRSSTENQPPQKNTGDHNDGDKIYGKGKGVAPDAVRGAQPEGLGARRRGDRPHLRRPLLHQEARERLRLAVGGRQPLQRPQSAHAQPHRDTRGTVRRTME